MSYNTNTRKWGAGYTNWAAHSGNVAPYYGEIDLDTMLGLATDLGGTTEGSEFSLEPEILEDSIAQELFPIQIGVGGAKGMFKATLSMGDAIKVAIAAGLAAPEAGSLPDSGKSAQTIVLGVVKPAWLTLVNVVNNVHAPGQRDVLYLPRVQVSPTVSLKTGKNEIRTAEVTFMCAPSLQDGTTGAPISEDLRILTGGVFSGLHGCGKLYEENAA